MKTALRVWHSAFCILHYVSLAKRRLRREAHPPSHRPRVPPSQFSDIHAELTKSCRGVRTLTAELGLAGVPAARRLRGRVIAGFEQPRRCGSKASRRSARRRSSSPRAASRPCCCCRATSASCAANGRRDPRRADRRRAWRRRICRPSSPDVSFPSRACRRPAARQRLGLDRSRWRCHDVPARAWARGRSRPARRNGWEVEYPTWQGAFPQVFACVRRPSRRRGHDRDGRADRDQHRSSIPRRLR